ncbi:MAG: rhomboid family intramembrane serine protease [Acidobacteriota bacterium]
MELDLLLRWLVGVATVGPLLLARRLGLRSVLGPNGAALVVLLLGLAFWTEWSGRVAAAAWAWLVLLPNGLAHAALNQVSLGRSRLSRWLARTAVVVQPFGPLRVLPDRVQLLDDLRHGRSERVSERVAAGGGLGRLARRLQLRAEARWDELLAETERGGISEDQTVPLEGRARLELGDLPGLIELRRGQPTRWMQQLDFLTLVGAGRRAGVEAGLAGPLSYLSAGWRDYWRAVTEQASGGDGAARLASVETAGDRPLEASVRHRQETPLRVEPPSLEQRLEVDALEAELRAQHVLAFGFRKEGRAWATLVLVAALVAAFLIELRGGSTSLENLERLGALVVPAERGDGSWYRLVSAGFLHHGPWHLLLNLSVAWVLGRYLELTWGRLRMLVVYFGALLGSNGLALAWPPAGPDETSLIVGASGAVMGLVGALLILFVRELRRRPGLRFLRQHLEALVLFVGLQVVFDLFVPVVSARLHLSGLVMGALLALALGRPVLATGPPREQPAAAC